jgi:4a-hydroxytetrahydrobiopterin dehydratase
MSEEEARSYLPQTPDWELREGKSIRRRFRFGSFIENVAFVNKIASIAEAEDHHPDLRISYDRLTVDLTTHAIKGLSENDFILAAKIDEAYAERE